MGDDFFYDYEDWQEPQILIYRNTYEKLLQRIADLEEENRSLRELTAVTGPMTPNTNMIIGAMLAGGDVRGLAEKLMKDQG